MNTHRATPSLIPEMGLEVERTWYGKLNDVVAALAVGRAAKQAYDAEIARGADPADAVRKIFDRAA